MRLKRYWAWFEGKGTVAEILKKKNFTYHSLSDSLRDELKSLKKEETRENLINIGLCYLLIMSAISTLLLLWILIAS